jgi:hypothetical protein
MQSIRSLARSTGRGLLWLGVLCAIAGPALYAAQLVAWGRTFNPWYLPVLATLGAVLVILSLQRRRTVWRGLTLVLVLFLAVADWWFLASYVRLPVYAGPVAAGEPFPEFQAKRADGATFTRADLKGDRATALVFFRGHW